MPNGTFARTFHISRLQCAQTVLMSKYVKTNARRMYKQAARKLCDTNVKNDQSQILGYFWVNFLLTHAYVRVNACVWQAINLNGIFNKSSDQFWIKFPVYIV